MATHHVLSTKSHKQPKQLINKHRKTKSSTQRLQKRTIISHLSATNTSPSHVTSINSSQSSSHTQTRAKKRAAFTSATILATTRKFFSTSPDVGKTAPLSTSTLPQAPPAFHIPTLDLDGAPAQSEDPIATKKRSKLLRNTLLAVGLLGGLAGILLNVSAHPMISQPVKDVLEAETAAALTASMEQMAAVGLIDLKLIPRSVVEGMADESKLTFNIDPSTVIEKPEIGHFINSASVLKGLSFPSINALPHNFDPVNENEPNAASPVTSYIHREALRNQYISFVKDCYELAHNGLNAIFFKTQSLLAMMEMVQTEHIHFAQTANIDLSPIRSIERAVDILFLRDNNYAEKLLTLAKLHPQEDFGFDASPTRGTFQLGNELQHFMLDKTTLPGRILQNADDKFIQSISLPDESHPVIQNHPFRDELFNIPEHIKSHPDRTTTGPLFEYYYNIFSRNQYNNMLLEENKFLMHHRNTLLRLAEPFRLSAPPVVIDGETYEHLSEPALQPYTDFAKATVDSKVGNYGVQTPLLPQPFHYFTSTGVLVEDFDNEGQGVSRTFKDIMPRDAKVGEIPYLSQYLSPDQTAVPIERFVVTPRMGPDQAFAVDTRSFTRLALDDTRSFEWDYFNQLPPLYHATNTNTEYNPQIAEDIARVMTKIDTTILRNQYEIGRIQHVAFDNNPTLTGIYRELEAEQKKVAEEQAALLLAQQSAASAAEQAAAKESAPFWKIW